MTSPQLAIRSLSASRTLIVILMAGFACALALRVLIGQPQPAMSAPAGLIFASCLVALSVAAGGRISFKLPLKVIAIGLAGGLLLCVPAYLAGASLAAHPAGSYLGWSLVVAVVALAEEAFFRGVLYSAVKRWRGEQAAIMVAAIGFALLHVPLYGWHVLPLDLAVGIWFGCLRAFSGSWIAPGIAHTLADLLGWWIV